MKTKYLACQYCGEKISYMSLANDLLDDVWHDYHQECKDFMYIKKINIKQNKKEVENGFN